MERQIMQNEELGNFGFLLEYDDFLFELAELAESSYYVNRRMCTVFIRQLMEAFLDTIIDDRNINLKYQPTILDKEIAIIEHCRNTQNNEDKVLKKIFPDRNDRSPITRISCPYKQGDGLEKSDSNNKIYIWDYIRILGNKGSHTKMDSKSKEWLKERYIAAALKELCIRMKSYFMNQYLLDDHKTFFVDRIPIGSREILFPVSGKKELKIPEGKLLPKHTEVLCSSVTPFMLKSGQFSKKWENYVSRYYLVRRFDMHNVTYNVRLANFLVHAQKAYMLLQGTPAMQWLAAYDVLADLRDKGANYVSAYGFDTIPLSFPEAIAKGISSKNVCTILSDLLQAVSSLCEEHVYLRSIKPESIRLCENQTKEFSLRLIDLETCKLFDNIDETVYGQAKEADPSLEGIDENASEVEHRTWVSKRIGIIIATILELENLPLKQAKSQEFQEIAQRLINGELDLKHASKALKERI